MKIPDNLIAELQMVGSGGTIRTVVKILEHMLERDKDMLVRALSEETRGKALRAQELIKLFTPGE